jgi:TetR/AcrR family transcriptional repressor of nem operon
MKNHSSGQDMQERIKKAATELLIKHGYRGASMAKIANLVHSTTTNIHYHFTNKERLVEEVIADYVVDALKRQKDIWTNPGTPLREKIAQVVEFNRERHRKFNRRTNGGHAWSLIGRLRLENDMLSERGRQSLTHFTEALQEYITTALRQAVEKGEIVQDTPVQDAALILTNIVNSSSVFSQDAGSFSRLEEFYAVFARFFFRSYGAGKLRDEAR